MFLATSSTSASASRSNLFAVVMAGGPGSRLWPESRRARPKPFLPLAPDGRTLAAATFDRLDGLVAPENRLVVVGRAFAKLAADAIPTLRRENALLEPVGRDTAPCVLWSALEALRRNPDPTLVVLPSDHWIAPDDAFRATLRRAVALVDDDPRRLVLLGVKPTEPSSAFGYLERGAVIPGVPGAFQVARFREKPDAPTAKRFFDDGSFYWNAGVFVWKARRILDVVRECDPELTASFAPVAERVRAASDGARTDADPAFADAFARVKRVSIDRAALERAPNVAMIEANSFLWSDVGSFAALERLRVPSQIPVELVEYRASGSFVRVAPRPAAPRDVAPTRKVVAIAGVDDLLVVDAGDALLVAKKGDDAAIRELVERLRERGLDVFL